MGTHPPSPEKGQSPLPILAHACYGKTAGWIKRPLGTEVGVGPGDIVLDGDALPPSQKGRGRAAPQFSAHVYRGQTARWIKMPLGTEVGLGPGHIVLDGDPARLAQKGTAPNFGPCMLWPNGWMDQDATWYWGRPRTRRH